MPPFTDMCVGGIIVWVVRPWVHACVRPCVSECVRACVRKSLLARYLANQWTEFHQTLVDDVLQTIDDLIRFWRSSGQGRYKARCEKLGDLLFPKRLEGLQPNWKSTSRWKSLKMKYLVSFCGGRRYWRLSVEVPGVPKKVTPFWYSSFLPLLEALFAIFVYLHIIFIKCLISESSVVSIQMDSPAGWCAIAHCEQHDKLPQKWECFIHQSLRCGLQTALI